MFLFYLIFFLCARTQESVRYNKTLQLYVTWNVRLAKEIVHMKST